MTTHSTVARPSGLLVPLLRGVGRQAPARTVESGLVRRFARPGGPISTRRMAWGAWWTCVAGVHFATASLLSAQAPPNSEPLVGGSAPQPTALAGSIEEGSPPHTVGRLLLGGLAGGGAGLLVGGLAGAWVGGNHCSDSGNPDSCRGLEGMVIGAITGQAIGISTGVHLANGRKGQLAPSLAVNAALAAAGAAVVVLSERRSVAVGVVLVVPVAQMMSSILIDRRSSQR